MASQWFYQVMGEQNGPVSSEELRNLAQRGTVTPNTPVRKAPDGVWVPAERVNGLFAISGKTPPPPPPVEATVQPVSHTAAVEAEDSGLTTTTKVVMGACGAVCIVLLGFLVWFIAARDTWELDNASRISAKLAEADRLQQTDFLTAYKTYDEVLKEAKPHKITDEQFGQKLASAEKARTALYPKVQEKTQAEEAEKRRLAEEKAKREAAERDRIAAEKERKRAAEEAERRRIEEEKRLASIRANIKGGAWLTKKAGNSETLRGLKIYVLRARVKKEQYQTMLHALLDGGRIRLQSAKDWEKALGELPFNFDALVEAKAQVTRREMEAVKTHLLVLEAEEAVTRTPGTATDQIDVDVIFRLFAEILPNSTERERSAWSAICSEQTVAVTHTDVDGKYSVAVSGGNYYLYATFTSSYSVVEWFVPVKVSEAKDVAVDLHNATAERITNKNEPK